MHKCEKCDFKWNEFDGMTLKVLTTTSKGTEMHTVRQELGGIMGHLTPMIAITLQWLTSMVEFCF